LLTRLLELFIQLLVGIRHDSGPSAVTTVAISVISGGLRV